MQFQHDLMGDWARYRVLIFAENNAVSEIRAIASIPRWGRAIRLFAQSLAERKDELASWKSAWAQLSGADAEAVLASDIFLDGLLFAANSEVLLEQVWPNLIADGRHDSATAAEAFTKRGVDTQCAAPGWLIRNMRSNPRRGFASRIPFTGTPALNVFSRHAKDLAEHALLLAAEICALWLRTMPKEFLGAGSSLIALELAKETQGRIAEGMHFGDKDKIVYEACCGLRGNSPTTLHKSRLN